MKRKNIVYIFLYNACFSSTYITNNYNFEQMFV